MKKNIIIIWAWLHAEVVKNIISYDLNNNFIWFLDDNKKWDNILWNIDNFLNYIDSHYFICSIWDNIYRDIIFNKIKNNWWKFINAIHPKSYIEEWVLLWEWIMIWANSYINICSKIWSNSIINNWVIIEHHNTIGNSVHIAPWVVTWWSVMIWNKTFIWLWSNIINNIKIWNENIIWAGTLVNKDINKDKVKVFWVPFIYR